MPTERRKRQWRDIVQDDDAHTDRGCNTLKYLLAGAVLLATVRMIIMVLWEE